MGHTPWNRIQSHTHTQTHPHRKRGEDERAGVKMLRMSPSITSVLLPRLTTKDVVQRKRRKICSVHCSISTNDNDLLFIYIFCALIPSAFSYHFVLCVCVCCALSLFLYFWAHNIVHFSSRSFAGSLEFFVSMCSVVARSPISFVHFDHSPKWNKKPFLPSFCNASIFPFMQKALFSLSPSQVCAWLDHSHGCMVLAYLKLHKCTSTIIENVQHKKDFNAFFPRAIYFSFHFDVRKCVCARPTVCVW